MKIVLFVILILPSLVMGQFSGGSGSINDPYQIRTVDELDSVRNHLSSNFVLMNDLDMDTTIYAKGDGLGLGWNPIGNSSTNCFVGSFNGKGHVIKNLFIHRLMTNVGLFGFFSGLSLDSLGVENCYVMGSSRVGGLVGYNYFSNVNNCYSTGFVFGTSDDVGGIIGKSYASTVSRSYSTATIGGNSNVGGLIGSIYTYGSIKTEKSVDECFASSVLSWNSYGGGLVGRKELTSNITKSYSNSSISKLYSKDDTLSVSKTSVEMMKQSTFENWDFVSTWTISESVSYPYLSWQKSFVTINNAPKVTKIPDQKILARLAFDSIILDSYVFDSNDADNNITWLVEGCDSITVTIENRVAKVRPSLSFIGSDTVTFIATDSCGASDSCFVIFEVEKSFSFGAGTVDDPYKISTLHELDLVRYFLSSHFILMNDLDFIGSEWDSTSSEGWLPIRNGNTSFSGTLHGKGFTLKNLYINRPNETYNCGLFAQIEGAIIDSLSIETCIIIGGKYYIGSLAGTCKKSSIINYCNASGSVEGGSYIGGLVGDNSESAISHSSAKCIISGKNQIGGLIGINSLSNVNYCFSEGLVNGDYNVGGLIGKNSQSSIECNYSSGSVKGVQNIGGLTGYNYMSSKFTNCYSMSSVEGSYYVGGLIGYNAYVSQGDPFLISNCYSMGDVLGTELTIGGLVGVNDNVNGLLNCYYDSTTSHKSDFNGRGIPMGTTQMLQASTYENWDFNGVWSIHAKHSYPYFSWQKSYDILNNVPSLTTIDNPTVDFGNAITLLLSMTDASDMDGDSLWLIVKTSNANCSIDGVTITADPFFSGTIELQVAVTDGMDTSSSFDCNVTFDTQTGINGIEFFALEGYTLQVAPTPTEDCGKLMFSSEEKGEVTFTILNENEKLISRKIVQVNSTEMIILNWDVISLLPKGIYYVVMRVNGEEKAVKRLIKL